MNALAVFHSHWFSFSVMKPVPFLIGSIDQLNTFCPTVLWVSQFWLNASFRPPGRQQMQTTKIKLRLGGRPLRKSVGVISNVVRTALYGQPGADIPVAQRAQAIRRQQWVVSGSPRTHVSKRKRRLFNKPPPQTKGFVPIQHPVTPRKYTPLQDHHQPEN